MANELTKIRALCKVGAAIFGRNNGRNNVIGTDFADIRVCRIEREFPQDSSGVKIQFTISNHALGKLSNGDVATALDVLLSQQDSE